MNALSKILFFEVIICLIFAPQFSRAETIDEALKRQLQVIKLYRADDAEDIHSANQIASDAQKMLWTLGNTISTTAPDDGTNAFAERRALIERIGLLIAPYNDALLRIGFTPGSFSESSPLFNISRECRFILNYTKPDGVFANALRAHTTGMTGEASSAYDLLFQHRQLTAAERTELGRKVLEEPDQGKRTQWAIKCSMMRIPEAIPVLREMLTVPFKAEGTIGSTGIFGENTELTNYRRAIEAINYLGPLAASLSPLLKERLKELKAELPPEQSGIYAAQFQAAIDQAEGRKPILVAVAINGSGPLLKDPGIKGEQKQPNPGPETAAPLMRTSPTPTARATSSFAEALASRTERIEAVWLWVVGIAALIAIVALVLKRRV